MRVVLQRVSEARVDVDDVCVGAISAGLVALVGVASGDTSDDVATLAHKTAALRIFDTDGGARSVRDTDRAVLVVSQFTLLADTRRGNRPSWSAAAAPDVAAPLVEEFADQLRSLGIEVACGRFGAHMRLPLTNDGPVTIVLDTAT